MDKTLSMLALLIAIAAAAAVGGCIGGNGTKTAVTVGPTDASPTDMSPTALPSPTPVVSSVSVATSGNLTIITGSDDQAVKPIMFEKGVYDISWSGDGTSMSTSISDTVGNSLGILSQGTTSGDKLFIVDGIMIQPGYAIFRVLSNGDWTIKVTSPDASSADTLPVTIKTFNAAASRPFQAGKGDIKISYTFSGKSTGEGAVSIYDLSTGAPFYVRPMASDVQAGQSNAEVPATGVYIAQVTLPPGVQYGEITISQ